MQNDSVANDPERSPPKQRNTDNKLQNGLKEIRVLAQQNTTGNSIDFNFDTIIQKVNENINDMNTLKAKLGTVLSIIYFFFTFGSDEVVRLRSYKVDTKNRKNWNRRHKKCNQQKYKCCQYHQCSNLRARPRNNTAEKRKSTIAQWEQFPKSSCWSYTGRFQLLTFINITRVSLNEPYIATNPCQNKKG